MKTIINLTPHVINIGERTFPASGQLARVAVINSPCGDFDGLPLVSGTYGSVTGLPPQEDGTLLLVSAMVRAALPGRKDLASPSGLVRDAAGVIVGASALEVNR